MRECSAAECVRVASKRGYCDTHYQQVRKHGEIKPMRYSRSDPKICLMCGAKDWPPNGRRRHCSHRCERIYNRHKGERPASLICAHCTQPFDLAERSARSGRTRRADSLICGTCRRAKYTRHKFSVAVIAQRDGTACGICGDEVDMTLRNPDPMRPSIDHIVPVAKGGAMKDPTNLQLAHLRCNVRRRDQPLTEA